MTKPPKEICLKALNKPSFPKKATMKTHYWEETITRPKTPKGNWGVLASEIYGNPHGPTEHNTIKALNELVTEGKVTMFYYNNYFWYAKA